METNKGIRSRPIRWLYLATRETFWRVMKVDELEQESLPTFCAVVPGAHEFTLAGGVYTHNCGACEPECPVEAITPEEDVPDKWRDFIAINYAYGDGAEKVNPLVDDYLADHELPDIAGYRPRPR